MAADGARGVSSFIDSLTSDIAIALAQVGLKRVIDINDAILASPTFRKSGGAKPILLRGKGSGS
jgi:hypothetical protein